MVCHGLPANPLYMIVRGNGQFIATLQAPTLEDFPTIRGGHALAETVNTDAVVNLGLISSLCCHQRSFRIL